MPETPPPPGFHPDFYPRAVNFYPDLNTDFLSSERETRHSYESSIISNSNNVVSHIGASWQHCNINETIPTTNLVRAGIDSDGSKIFVGRAFHEGDMIPAKVIPEKNVAFICYGGEEILKEDFEIMRSGSFVWEFASGGVIPEGAIEIGRTNDGENLYMGRALYQGTQTPGKIQPSHGCLYIPFEGAEIPIQEYEVLCIK